MNGTPEGRTKQQGKTMKKGYALITTTTKEKKKESKLLIELKMTANVIAVTAHFPSYDLREKFPRWTIRT